MRRRRSPILTTLAVAALSLLAAGCGGGSRPGVANVGGSTAPRSPSSGGRPNQAQILHALVRFTQCMHSHGAPSFPSPIVSPTAFKNAIDTNSRSIQSAETACAHLLPPGRERSQNTARRQAQTVALLAFARCLRSHGFPSFPDPTGSGQVTRQMLATAGIDLHSPAVVQAADACTSVTHGVITRAVVARFVARFVAGH
jgi:hypothetical protein